MSADGALEDVAQPLDYVRIRFRTHYSAPVSSEGMWALDFGTGRYQVANVPFFVDGIGLGDIVEAAKDDSGELWAGEVRHSCGHATIRVVPPIGGWEPGDIEQVAARLEGMGAGVYTAAPDHDVVSLDIPPGINLLQLKATLDIGSHNGMWRIEEGCVTREWREFR